MITAKGQQAAVEKLFNRIREAGFWGNVIFQVRNGDIVMTKLEQTAPFEEIAGGDTVPLVVLEKKHG